MMTMYVHTWIYIRHYLLNFLSRMEEYPADYRDPDLNFLVSDLRSKMSCQSSWFSTYIPTSYRSNYHVKI